MANPSVTNTFANSTTADASQVNTNFNDIINALTDGTKSLTIDALSCAGSVTLGNASSDDLTLTASLASTLNIKTTYTYDFGSSTIGLRKLFLGANDSAARTAAIQAGAVSSSYTLTLPTTAGSAGNILRNSGSGTLVWQTGDQSVNGFRLTLTTAVPVTTTDVTGATTIYCTPYKGNQIALYDGTSWNVRTSAEFSLALGTLSSGKPYDVFCYDNSGTPTLEFLVWTDDTTRATALALQDGIYVKSGAATRRYLGTFYTTSTTETEDSVTKRYLYNFYNQESKPLKREESEASWNYTTATIRQARGNTSNQVNVMNGLNTKTVRLNLLASVGNNGACDLFSGIGLDSTSTQSVGAFQNVSNNTTALCTTFDNFVGVGRHYLTWLESSAANGTSTWYSVQTWAGATTACGLYGSFWC